MAVIEREYYYFEELINQYECSLYDLIYYYENNLIDIKAAVPEIMAAAFVHDHSLKPPKPKVITTEAISGIVALPYHDMLKLLKYGHFEVTKLKSEEYDYWQLIVPVTIGIKDLVAPKDVKEYLEKQFIKEQSQKLNFRELPNGNTEIEYKGERYIFGRMQTAIIKKLYAASNTGNPWLYGKTILKDVGSQINRLGDVFKGNPAWKKRIVGNNQGLFRLYLE